MTRSRKPLLLVALLAALAIPAGGVAYAYWTAAGVGSGAGNTATTVAITLSPGTPTSTLYPGGQTGVVLTATNPNLSEVRITSLSLNTSQGTGGFSVDAGHAGCSVATLGFTTQTNGGNGWTLPARVGVVNGSLPITLSNALTMGVAAANACQGATFTIYLAAG